MEFFTYFLLLVFSGLLGISSLFINSNTNAAYVTKKVRKVEGLLGILLVLASLYLFINTIMGFHSGAWHIIKSIFALITTLAGLGLGALFFLTFFQPAPLAVESSAAPAAPADGVPPVPGIPPSLQAGASALAGIKIPLGFAVLGLALLMFIFSFIHGGGGGMDGADAAADAIREMNEAARHMR